MKIKSASIDSHHFCQILFRRPFLYSGGFTLLEIMVAMVILASATAGLFASFIAAEKFVGRSRRRLAAANACRLIAEDLKAAVSQQEWSDPVGLNPLCCPGGGYPCVRDYVLPASYPSGSPWNWRAQYEISLVDVGGVPMRKVRVEVRWDEPD